MNTELEFSFRSNSLVKESFIEVINDFLFFNPIIAFINSKSVRKKDRTNIIKYCENLPEIETVLINSEDAGIVMLESKRHKQYPYMSIAIWLPYCNFIEHESAISNWSKKDGFLSLLVTHHDYSTAQNQESLETLYVQKRTKYVGNYITKIGTLGKEEIDVSKNPGRKGYNKNGCFTAAWKMWFSKAMQDEYPQISNLPLAPFVYKTEKVFNDILFVQLFENLEDSYSKEGKVIQESFLKWIDFDNIAIL